MTWKELIKDAPYFPGVYLILAKNVVIYVGSTNATFPGRLKQHHKKQIFERMGATQIAYICMPGEGHQAVATTERFYLDKFKPELDRIPANMVLKPEKEKFKVSANLVRKIISDSGLKLTQFAYKHGVTPQLLSDLSSGRRELSSALADKMGYEWVLVPKKTPAEAGGL